jgi:hypothetical protein
LAAGRADTGDHSVVAVLWPLIVIVKKVTGKIQNAVGGFKDAVKKAVND